MRDGRALDLRSRAEDDLRAIRLAMEGSARFTSVSGAGEMAAGATALVAAAISFAAAARKARRSGGSLWSLPARRFALSLAPPLAAGAALTPLLYRAGLLDVLPGAWLLLYGAGVVTGGAFSVRIVPLTGVAFMLAGAAALLLPDLGRDAWMALGFGGIHLVFGAALMRGHGG